MTTPQTILSVAQAAELLHITPRAVHHRIKSGKLAATKLGSGVTSAYVIERAEVERVLRGEAA
jgi:excisionase family DNA binding protein